MVVQVVSPSSLVPVGVLVPHVALDALPAMEVPSYTVFGFVAFAGSGGRMSPLGDLLALVFIAFNETEPTLFELVAFDRLNVSA